MTKVAYFDCGKHPMAHFKVACPYCRLAEAERLLQGVLDVQDKLTRGDIEEAIEAFFKNTPDSAEPRETEAHHG